jgi:hypothetical protein
MVLPVWVKPATACGEPASNIEQLGGKLDRKIRTQLRHLQALKAGCDA